MLSKVSVSVIFMKTNACNFSSHLQQCWHQVNAIGFYLSMKNLAEINKWTISRYVYFLCKIKIILSHDSDTGNSISKILKLTLAELWFELTKINTFYKHKVCAIWSFWFPFFFNLLLYYTQFQLYLFWDSLRFLLLARLPLQQWAKFFYKR